ncbi:MAG: transketolase, partial [Candidatus Margulisbacteria bacterium]|nr:transketolase [Candidatus Margulisiibacteriota bacterium]
NLSLMSQLRPLNMNLISVGAGLSYDISGPTHHCLEDISVIRTLPNIMIFSPSDWVLAEQFVDHALEIEQPKYLRFDSKPLPAIYDPKAKIDLQKGFHELSCGGDICLVSTGYMTHQAMQAVAELRRDKIDLGQIDLFMIRPFDANGLYDLLKGYKHVISLEEAFIDKGGIDSLIADLLLRQGFTGKFTRIGIGDKHIFNVGDRAYLHGLNGTDVPGLVSRIKEILNK